MSRLRDSSRKLAVLLIAATLSGCDNEIPTFTGGGRFPDGSVPPTLVREFSANEFLLSASSLTGPTSIADFRSYILAQNFDGLSATLLAAFELPDTVNVAGSVTEDFIYADSNVVAIAVPDSLAFSRESLAFDLWAIAEPWDTSTVSWQYAVNQVGEQVAWTEPGGTRAEYLGLMSWNRLAGEGAQDSVTWRDIPGEAIERLHRGETHGLMVTLRDQGHQAVVGNIRLEVGYITALQPDSVVRRNIPTEFQTFVYNLEPERPAGVMRVGGVTSDRTLLRIALNHSVPGCAPAGSGCAPVSLSSVSINRVDLVLNPIGPTRGYRPVAPLRLSAWRTVEPELGERAPLASVIDVRLVPSSSFSPATPAPQSLDLTFAVLGALARGETELGIALLVEPEASTFAFGWFDLNPQLRFIYTLPATPGLP